MLVFLSYDRLRLLLALLLALTGTWWGMSSAVVVLAVAAGLVLHRRRPPRDLAGTPVVTQPAEDFTFAPWGPRRSHADSH